MHDLSKHLVALAVFGLLLAPGCADDRPQGAPWEEPTRRDASTVDAAARPDAARVDASLADAARDANQDAVIDERIRARLDGRPIAGSPDAPTIVYPLDNAVMPRNVFPADVQWTPGRTGDAFRISLRKTRASAIEYVTGTNHFVFDRVAWRAVADTDPDEPAVLEVIRYDRARDAVYASAPVRITFAQGSLVGSIYYWSVAEGRIVRINDGSATRESFLPSPPSVTGGSTSCIACHSVSRSGRYLAGFLNDISTLAVFDLTTDLRSSPARAVSRTASGALHAHGGATWNADDSRLLTVGANSLLQLIDPATGSAVLMYGTPPTNAVTTPSWAPDGHAVAYSSIRGRDSVHSLSVVDITAPDTFGDSRVIHEAPESTGVGTGDWYPSWAPDSQHMAYTQFDTNYYGSSSASSNSSIFLIREDGTNRVRLDNANGSVLATLRPQFSPFDSGGYFWLAFVSRRPYGHYRTGADTPPPQIWVTAIRKDAEVGEDPSSVPYWLPGQNPLAPNLDALWAPRACRDTGDPCSGSGECCSDECLPTLTGATTCQSPPPERCREEEETCSADTDCCESDDFTCYMRVCVPRLR